MPRYLCLLEPGLKVKGRLSKKRSLGESGRRALAMDSSAANAKEERRKGRHTKEERKSKLTKLVLMPLRDYRTEKLDLEHFFSL